MRESTDAGEKLTARRGVFIVYIDGYNLYKAIDHPSTLKLGWCNYKMFATELVKLSFGMGSFPDGEDALMVKYFTALVRQKSADPRENTGGHKGEEDRQRRWLDALRDETGITPIPGLHIRHGDHHLEKMTDVNIALAMAEDARTICPLGVVLVSGDFDLCPAVARVVKAGIPIMVYNPNEHPNYSLPADASPGNVPVRRLFEMRYLGKDTMHRCGLGREPDWILYLEKKTESYRMSNPEYFSAYSALLEAEKRAQNNRRRSHRDG
jgi:hypothetical protein